MPQLLRACEVEIARTITVDNLFEALGAALAHNAVELERYCIAFASQRLFDPLVLAVLGTDDRESDAWAQRQVLVRALRERPDVRKLSLRVR